MAKRKKCYKKNKVNRKKVWSQLQTMRKEMRMRHPGVMGALQALLQRAEDHDSRGEQKQTAEAFCLKQAVSCDDEMVQIDRAKNLETILRYVEINPEADMGQLKTKLRAFLN